MVCQGQWDWGFPPLLASLPPFRVFSFSYMSGRSQAKCLWIPMALKLASHLITGKMAQGMKGQACLRAQEELRLTCLCQLRATPERAAHSAPMQLMAPSLHCLLTLLACVPASDSSQRLYSSNCMQQDFGTSLAIPSLSPLFSCKPHCLFPPKVQLSFAPLVISKLSPSYFCTRIHNLSLSLLPHPCQGEEGVSATDHVEFEFSSHLGQQSHWQSILPISYTCQWRNMKWC